jgi:hypothetical protein
VPSIDPLISRFPNRELAIRKHYVRDPEFRAVCGDYCDVQHALEYWQAADQAVPGRIAEYRQMLRELEAEVLMFLKTAGNK